MMSKLYIKFVAMPEVPSDPLSRFSLSIFTVNGLLMQSGEIVTRPFGQSSARWQVLGRAGYQPQTVAQMARDIGNSRQSVQRIADALAKDGLLAYVANPGDKRAQLVELTQKGADVLTAIYARDQEWSEKIVAKLDPEHLVKIAEALENIARIFELHLNVSRTKGEN